MSQGWLGHSQYDCDVGLRNPSMGKVMFKNTALTLSNTMTQLFLFFWLLMDDFMQIRKGIW